MQADRDRGDQMKWDEIGRERLPDSLPRVGSIEGDATRETGKWNADTKMKKDTQIAENSPLQASSFTSSAFTFTLSLVLCLTRV
jgi:hypothetical protein